ncbi:Os01g0877001 [Oryza sativa Japonica Group]|uniref:Os01g0877001 protein n=2 Tax=Oryza sativa subsp. japonica TaxID=39947 RepID=C7IXD1_ORYSJ|nr:hypothetical protein EE612_007140 [Oryza sativa]BAH91402.1 Os01g0877001 [Oryza sativa Japonica Group]BAS75514.1 Os01g0877001 [Oryza sativa Japonica Group]|eukprot:NP_001172672.1 Os01g0877001 [Oryza sativa Japonica Group]
MQSFRRKTQTIPILRNRGQLPYGIPLQRSSHGIINKTTPTDLIPHFVIFPTKANSARFPIQNPADMQLLIATPTRTQLRAIPRRRRGAPPQLL